MGSVATAAIEAPSANAPQRLPPQLARPMPKGAARTGRRQQEPDLMVAPPHRARQSPANGGYPSACFDRGDRHHFGARMRSQCDTPPSTSSPAPRRDRRCSCSSRAVYKDRTRSSSVGSLQHAVHGGRTLETRLPLGSTAAHTLETARSDGRWRPAPDTLVGSVGRTRAWTDD